MKETEYTKLRGELLEVLALDLTTGLSTVTLWAPEGPVALKAYLGLPIPGQMLEVDNARLVGHLERGLGLDVFEPLSEVAVFEPKDTRGIKTYLTSSGVSSKLSSDNLGLILDIFGNDTLSILRFQPERLAKLDDLSPKIREDLIESYSSFLSLRYLASHYAANFHLGPLYAALVLRSSAKPPQEIRDSVRKILSLGLPIPLDPLRRLAKLTKNSKASLEEYTLINILNLRLQLGYDHLNTEELIFYSMEFLASVEPPSTKESLRAALGRLSLNLITPHRGSAPGEDYSQLAWLSQEESNLIGDLYAIMETKRRIDFPEAKVIQKMQGDFMRLKKDMRYGMDLALEEKIVIMDLESGTSAQTIMRILYQVVARHKGRIALCAPSAQEREHLRMRLQLPVFSPSELLEWSPHSQDFTRGPLNPMDLDMLIIKSGNFIDLSYFSKLVAALPKTCVLVIMGDRFLRGSTNPGDLFDALISLRTFPAVKLQEVLKLDRGGDGGKALRKVRSGRFPTLVKTDPGADFIFVDEEDPIKVKTKILSLFLEFFPRRLKLPPESSSLAISFGEGEFSALNLNRLITSKYLEIYGEAALLRGQYPKIFTKLNNFSRKERDIWHPNPSKDPKPDFSFTASHLFQDFQLIPGQRVSLRDDIPQEGLQATESVLITKVNPVTLTLEVRHGNTPHTIRGEDLAKIMPSWALDKKDAKYVSTPGVIMVLDPNSTQPDRRDLYLCMNQGTSFMAVIGPKRLLARTLADFEPREGSGLKLEAFLK
ncbi:MAG: AAA family ATPase [Deltaproteobacteria bacterium]|nr:AAA family ATPase [Deltaproteobacteria bacterium]